MTIIAKTPRWLPIAVVALVLYTLVTVALRLRSPAGPPPARAPDLSGLDTASSDSVVERALGQIPPAEDSTVIKTGWRDDVPGVDLDSFTAARREIFLRVANSRACTCGCGYTLAACRTFDTTCPVSGPRVLALADSVRRGWIASARGLRERPRGRARRRLAGAARSSAPGGCLDASQATSRAVDARGGRGLG